MGMYVDLTDGQLVARCRAGDQEAWNELVERSSRYVYAISVQAFKLSEHDAEDVFRKCSRAHRASPQAQGRRRDPPLARPVRRVAFASTA